MGIRTDSNRITSIALQTLGWAGVLFMAVILLGIVGGPTFHPILEYIGLDIPGYRGIFIDCSLYENRHSDFCKRGGRKITHGLGDRGGFDPIEKGALPFTLHD